MKLSAATLAIAAGICTGVCLVPSSLPAQELAGAPVGTPSAGMVAGAPDAEGFVALMDGKTFSGWKPTDENSNTWVIEDGAFVTQGKRSHLFYTGPLQPFKNFELKLDARTTSGSNGGVYIHTAYQAEGWPKAGYEIQVNQTHSDWRKSGSIYSVNDVKTTSVKDDEWYSYDIIVKDKQIVIKLNDQVVNDWTEEAGRKPGEDFTRILTSGTIALQAHDPKSRVEYKNIRIKKTD